jgi:hypothetical protein
MAVALALTCAASASVAASTADAKPAPDSPLATVQAFLDAMGRKDKAAILSLALPTGSLASLKDGEVRQLTFTEFAEHIAAVPKPLAERISDPLVKVDDDLAVVWAPYTFVLDGKAHHCGTDLFSLQKIKGRWTITAVADNNRACTGS